MKKEVRNYLSIGFLVLAVLVLAYLLNLGITGFAVFEQQTQTDFNEGIYENVVYDTNASTVVLDVNQTSGTYMSKIFDASEEATWNTLTWTGQGDLVFEVRVCTSLDCANESFASATFNNLNLTAQYFQYRVLFTEDPNLTVSLASVSIDYSVPELEPVPENVTVSVSEPTGEKASITAIPITFTTTGENITCWYNVAEGDLIVIENTTLDNCIDSSFDVDADGSYVFYIYANGTSGSAEVNSSFSVITPSCSNDVDLCEDEINCIEIGGGYWYDGVCNAQKEQEPPPPEPPEPGPPEASLSASEISTLLLNPGSSQKATLVVTNTGTKHLISCKVRPMGEFDSWILVSEEATNINIGKQHEFSFDVTVPEETEEGIYSLKVSIGCSEIFATRDFTVDVVKKKLEFEVISADRTRDDRVRVLYSLEELSGNDQDVVFTFSLVDANNVEVGRAEVNHSIGANSIDEFRTNININESLLPINETTNETLESELTLNVNFNSQIYSSSIQEKVLIGAPIGGFAIFEGVGAGEAVIFVIVLFVLVFIFIFARRMRRKGKTLKDVVGRAKPANNP
ncbi:hypothetical protein ES703_24409 [subsurface metagenome]